MPTRPQTDNSKALAAFIAAKAEIDKMLARLTTLSADHFGAEPDGLTWGHVGALLHKSLDGRTAPSLGQRYPVYIITASRMISGEVLK